MSSVNQGVSGTRNVMLVDATAQAQALARAELSSEQLLSAILAEISRLNARLNCYLYVDGSAALEAARASDLRRLQGVALGPLDGLPVAVKDNIDVQGMPTTAGLGSAMHVAEEDAPVVARLRAAGGIVIGKLNMDEVALGTTTANPHHGRCFNPWGARHVPGGSSGGSGSAVAAGLCALALGTDTMGSVRIPAACCGVVGLKPSAGRIPNRGVVVCSRRLDTVGPLVRSARDLDWILPIMEGVASADVSARHYAPYAPAGVRWPEITLAMAADLSDCVALAPEIEGMYARAQTALAARGTTLREISVADLDFGAYRRAGLMVVEGDLTVALGQYQAAKPTDLSPALRKMLAWIADRSAPDLAAADWTLDRAALALMECMQGAHALLLPTVPVPAFSHEDQAPAGHADLTAMVNMAGLPAISIPAGINADGLPLALQLVGPAGSEADLVAMAQELGTCLPQLPAPPVHAIWEKE